MRRQDSGYESIAPRDSMCSGRQTSSSASVSSPTSSRPKKRPHRHRRPRPGRNGRHSLSPPRITTTTFGSGHHQQPTPVTYFHFPLFTSSDPALYEADLPQPLALPSPSECPPAAARSNTTNTYYSFYPYPTRSETSSPSPLPSPTTVLGAGTGTSPSTYPYPPPLPPQTTHYWTSDRTRRLEYAAIDAASKGVRGWIVRHVVPDCFVPRSRRRLGFDDDRGSVAGEVVEVLVVQRAAPLRRSGGGQLS
ncbi:25cc3bb5-bda4-44b0-bb4e-e26866a127dd [Thermothielavioides terrestris]|uniref:25cc3bb5-bda4-44b0-bb4e-e26866a127dd n=1 Tax=Thermothielavioides terrestris TaxID=2587410 RepID=A0A446BVY3_9PEZI|nr:25cc3bb5-bda4-44b0-bb4e-e26866a127dd [Thermothielavioides terrestris]